MSNLTSTLSVRLLDDVSGPAGKAAGALRGLGASGADLKKLAAASPETARLVRELERLKAVAGKVDTFKVASRGLDDMGLNLRKARQDLAQAERLLARRQKTVEYFNRVKVEQPERYQKWKMDGLTAGVASNLTAAKRARDKAAKAIEPARADFMEQGRHVRTLRNELGALGQPLNALKGAEASLKAAIDATNAAIAKQPALLAAAEAKAQDLARASREQLRAAVEAGKASRAARDANAARAGRVERVRADVQAARPRMAEEAVAKVKAVGEARKAVRAEADPLLNPARGVADLRKVPELQAAIATRQALKAQAGAIEDFRADSRGLKQASQAYRLAQQDLRKLKAEMASAPSDAVAAKLAEAHAAVARTSAAFQAQGSAVRASKAALAEAGIGVKQLNAAEAGLASSIAKATGELQRQTGALDRNAKAQARAAERATARKEAGATIAAGAGVLAAHKVKEGAKLSLETYREFDKERRFGKAVMGLTDEEQAPLVDQAIHMGATTKFNDVQVLEGQRELAARGLKKEQVMGLMSPASDLGQSLDLSLPAAVKQMEGAIFGFKKPIGTLAEAMASARQTADVQVKAAKISGMTPEDISQAYKYGATPARMSGVSEQNLLAFAGISKKANMGGDESGVAFRALIAAATSPTRKGKEAMLANGLDYKNYQRNPDRIDTAAFKKTVAAQYGVKLDEKTTAKLDRIFTDQKMIKSPEQFTPAVMKLLSDNLGGDDAKSKKSIAGLANRFRDASMKGVDTNALITDLMKKLPDNLQLANAVFGSKQGSRIATALGDPDVFRHMIEELVNHSEGYSEKISKERMAGFDGAWSRLSGAAKNLETAVGRSWDNEGKGGALTALTDMAGRATQALAELPPGAVKAGSALAAFAGAAAGLWGGFRLLKTALGFGGQAASAAALSGSAVALDGSAAAITAAAARLGVSGVAGAATGAATAGAATAGAAAGGVSLGLGGAVILGGAAAGAAIDSATPGTNAGITGLITGAESSLEQTNRALREERLRERITGQLGPQAWETGLPRTLPGADARKGYASEVPVSRGALGDFLLGQRREAVTLPAMPSATPRVLPDAAPRPGSLPAPGVVPRIAAMAPAAPVLAPALGVVPRVAAKAPAPAVVPRVPALPAPVAPPAPGVMPRVAAPAAAEALAAQDPRRLALPPAPDAARIAEATAALAAYRAELASVGQQLAGLKASGEAAFSPETSGLEARKAELEASIDGVLAKVRALNAETIAPHADASGMDGIGTAADATQAKLAAVNGTTVSPKGDTSGLSALDAMLDQIAGKISRIGAQITAVRSQAASVSVPSAGASQPAAAGPIRAAPRLSTLRAGSQSDTG